MASFYDAMWDASLFVASSLLSLILSLEVLLSKKKATAWFVLTLC